MPAICWTRYFILAQGYGVREKIIYQDNRAQFFWRIMAKHQAQKGPSTSISNSISSQIE